MIPEKGSPADRAAQQVLRELGQRVRDLLAERALTSKALAEKASITPGYISRIAAGTRDVHVSTLVRLALALDIDLAELFRGLGPQRLPTPAPTRATVGRRRRAA